MTACAALATSGPGSAGSCRSPRWEPAGRRSRAPQPGADEVWAAYITAKTAAEADLRARDLDWTIVRPGRLTDAPATGRIRLAASPVPRGAVSRADIAAVIAALLGEPGTGHKTLELTGGESPAAAAVRGIS
jgi:uncharacterized protein YbjT (DUF2867 family)